MAGELNFRGSLQSLEKSEDFILALTSFQEIVKLKKITCSYNEAVFATGRKLLQTENGYISSQFLPFRDYMNVLLVLSVFSVFDIASVIAAI